MLESIFAFAFLMGLQHALEADHVAAVLTLASGTRTVGRRVTVATAWGAGHAATLVGFGLVLAALQIAIPPRVARGLEVVVAATLIALGIGVLRRLRRERVHLHVHRHDGAPPHLHAHAHQGDGAHAESRHDHMHPHGTLPKALMVGGIHGLAGSAALVVVSLATAGSAAAVVAWVSIFALGTILGMVLLSIAIALPLRVLGPSLDATAHALDGLLAMGTVTLGCWMVVQAVTSARAGG